MTEGIWIVLRVVAQHAGAAGVGDALDAVLARRLEDIPSPDDVGVQDRLPIPYEYPSPLSVEPAATARVVCVWGGSVEPVATARRAGH